MWAEKLHRKLGRIDRTALGCGDLLRLGGRFDWGQGLTPMLPA